MTETSLTPPPGRRRWVLAGLAALIVVVACVAGAYVLGKSDGGGGVEATTQPTRLPASVPDVQTRPVAGVDLPFSRLHGPRTTSDGRAAGYSRSELGAALAAVQVLARTSPSAGSNIFDPVLASQVTGSNLPAMKLAVADEYQRLRASTHVADGEPIPGNDASVRGFVIRSYQEDAAKVDVVLDSSQLQTDDQLVSFAVQLVWQGDDWRVVAPSNGDWGSDATTLGTMPEGLRKYES